MGILEDSLKILQRFYYTTPFPSAPLLLLLPPPSYRSGILEQESQWRFFTRGFFTEHPIQSKSAGNADRFPSVRIGQTRPSSLFLPLPPSFSLCVCVCLCVCLCVCVCVCVCYWLTRLCVVSGEVFVLRYPPPPPPSTSSSPSIRRSMPPPAPPAPP